MKVSNTGIVPGALGFLLFAALAAGAGEAQVQSADLAKFLPGEIDGWRPAAADELYTGDRIFEYIDGAGEVYRAYNYQALLARRYVKPGAPDIIADFFDMGAAADAFGVFTHGLEGERLEIGQDAVASEGQLSFWKDRYYISLYAETQTPEVRRALLGLGRAIAKSIPGEGHRPGILALFPQGFDIRQARYFHRHVILNYHYFVGSDNILFLDGRTEAALAAWRDRVRKTYLLIVRYPSDEDAEKARQSFEKSYLHSDAARAAVEIKRGKWSAAVSRRAHLFIAFDAATREEALDILGKAAGKLAGQTIIAHPEGVNRP